MNAAAPVPADGPQPRPPSGDAATAALEGDLRAVLDDRGLLAFSGADAATFLHAQLSTDVAGLARGDSQLTTCSDARGRLLAVGRLYARRDDLLLELPADRVEPLRQHLARYVLRAAVEISDVSGELARIGLAGDTVAATAGEAVPQAPGAGALTEAGVSIARLSAPRPAWQLVGPAAPVRAWWDSAADCAVVGDAAAWRLLEIAAGIPAIHAETSGQFVAQMLNLDTLGAIDFGKGCYPGQEVIARSHYLGRVKRRTGLLFAPEGVAPPAPGTAVHGETGAVGTVLTAAARPGGGSALLAVLAGDTGGELRLGSGEGPALERRPLPYERERETA